MRVERMKKGLGTRLLGFMIGNRGGILPTIAPFYPKNVCLLFNECAICTGLAKHYYAIGHDKMKNFGLIEVMKFYFHDE